MSLTLWSHPYSAYGQKASVALYELGLPFEQTLVEAGNEAVMAAFRPGRPSQSAGWGTRPVSRI